MLFGDKVSGCFPNSVHVCDTFWSTTCVCPVVALSATPETEHIWLTLKLKMFGCVTSLERWTRCDVNKRCGAINLPCSDFLTMSLIKCVACVHVESNISSCVCGVSLFSLNRLLTVFWSPCSRVIFCFASCFVLQQETKSTFSCTPLFRPPLDCCVVLLPGHLF